MREVVLFGMLVKSGEEDLRAQDFYYKTTYSTFNKYFFLNF